jgi:hypothetical protein
MYISQLFRRARGANRFWVRPLHALRGLVTRRSHQAPSPVEGTREDEDVWDVLSRLAGTVEGPSDWAEEHDHYLRGTPKKRSRRG